MNIIFPKPVTTKTVSISAENDCWEDIDKLCKQRGITQEQVINTLLNYGWNAYKEDQKEALPEPVKVTEIIKSEELPSGISTKKSRRIFTPEEQKAKQRAYAKEWYEKNKAKKPYWNGQKNNESPSAPEPQKPYVKTERAIKAENNARREEEHILQSVIYCANPECPTEKKIIRGMGVEYKGKEYCSDKCLEMILNTKKDEPKILELADL